MYIPSPCEKLVETQFEQYSNICCRNVGSNGKDNLSGPQKELLICCPKLGTSTYQIKYMLTEKKSKENLGVFTLIPIFIFPKFKSTPKFSVLKFSACQLAHEMNHNPVVINKSVIPEK